VVEGPVSRCAQITAAELGVTRKIGPGERMTFGRDLEVDFCFPGDRRLSRYVGEIRWMGYGVLITNLSRSHA